MSATGRPRRGAERSTYENLGRYYTKLDLARELVQVIPIRPGSTILEPQVGRGAFVRALREMEEDRGLLAKEGQGFRVDAMDLDPQAAAFTTFTTRTLLDEWRVGDFLSDPPPLAAYDLILGNPPYGNEKREDVASPHIQRALSLLAPKGSAAFLVRLNWLANGRRRWMYQGQRPRVIFHLVPRPSFEGFDGNDATEYAWAWWQEGYKGETFTRWLEWGEV